MVGSVSGPGSTFKAFLGSAQVRVPLSNKIRVRVGSVQHIYGSLRVRVRIFGPVKTSNTQSVTLYRRQLCVMAELHSCIVYTISVCVCVCVCVSQSVSTASVN